MNNRLQTVCNLLAAAQELVLQELEPSQTPPPTKLWMLDLQLRSTLEWARFVAGLVPPTAFQLALSKPLPPAPSPKKRRGGK